MSTTTRLVTADGLLALPHRDEQGNDCRPALIRGEVKILPLSGSTHGIVCAGLAAALLPFVEANNLGLIFGVGTGFVVGKDPDAVLGVDVSFVGNERLAGVENFDKFMPFAPDLAVEVVSPSDTAVEIDEKIALYFAAGSRLVWIVNPKRRTVAVYRSGVEARILGEQEALDGGEVLPGFSYKLSDLFAEV
jgi:Uma2 family endonuclease